MTTVNLTLQATFTKQPPGPLKKYKRKMKRKEKEKEKEIPETPKKL
jgi:hypothetical protein